MRMNGMVYFYGLDSIWLHLISPVSHVKAFKIN